MTEKFIDYYDSMSSPWSYLGHQRFEKLADRFGLTIDAGGRETHTSGAIIVDGGPLDYCVDCVAIIAGILQAF